MYSCSHQRDVISIRGSTMWRLIGLLHILLHLTTAELIDFLPGTEKLSINFDHYSGFFQVSDHRFLHFWFVESQRNPAQDPLIFWFNGGPGCSSLDGLLNEMGPYLVNSDGKTLRMNPNAWNQVANVVYIEAPAGVGYSYTTDGNVVSDDDQTAAENYAAIKEFFTEFPQFRNHSTFIMGESYGGIYVPTLTAMIIDAMEDFPVNLKGMALGNGYVDEVLNIDTSVRFAYSHGIIDQKVWDTLENECCYGCIDSCDLTILKGYCARMVEEIFHFLWYGGLNPYDLYRQCDPNPEHNSKRMRILLDGVSPRRLHLTDDDLMRMKLEEGDETDVITLLRNSPGRFLYGDAPCLNDSNIIQYMNRKDVREAIHIPSELRNKWDICNDKVTSAYRKQYGDMAPFITKILNSHVRVLLYYGDTDMACNFMMGQQFAAKLGRPMKIRKEPWKTWHNGTQIAGFKTVYDGLTFLTVLGAGHMAPQWRAPQMYYAIRQFLVNAPI